ncbi:MAG: ATP-dependent DNA helicase [candidate division WOR-3 bacterium]|nr:MAG: ATP-dependent DNA helicase [candidate division WOR-3 bacterium]
MKENGTKKQNLGISVRELVAYALRSGDLDTTQFGTVSPTDAIAAHTIVQNVRPSGYRREIPIHHQVETDDFVLEVSGRIDGLFTQTDPAIVEEIKTTREDLATISQREDPYHWGQVKTYAYMYAREHDLDRIGVQLTYFQREHGTMKEVRRSYTAAELSIFFNDLVKAYLEWAGMVVRWREVRDASIRNLTFPFESYRAGQEQMLQEVGMIIEQQSQLLVQAPTGIGKTMAVLLPSIHAIAGKQVSQSFYLTARTTGRQAAETTLNILRSTGLKLKSLSLTAKEKICFNPDRLCHPEECAYARGHFSRVNAALKDAFMQDSFTRDTIITLAKKHRVCPFEFALDLSMWVDCVVCDYNYVFDPGVFLRRFFEGSGGEYVLLIDEAHNLVDRAREMYSAALTRLEIQRVRNAVKGHLGGVHRILGRVNAWMIEQRTRCEEARNPIAEREPPAELYTLLRDFTKAAEKWLIKNKPARFREPLLDLYFDARTFLKTFDRYDDNYATCYLNDQRDITVRLFCIDPSRYLRETLERCRSAVFFSGTMKPMHYFIESIGCDDTAATLTLPSPFPNHNLCTLVASRVSTLYKHRERTKIAVAQMIYSFVEAKKGNFLVFFPSYKYMKMIHDVIHIQRPDLTILVQDAGMSEHEREQFLARFCTSNDALLVGFAVMGGVFAESIDLIGDRLTGAVIVGVGLPGISLERELIRMYFDDVNNCGYAFAYQFPGMIRVLQAAGRVIRSETDRGAVLMIGTRFAGEPYRSLLPEDWQTRDVENGNVMREILNEFWGR